MTNFDYNNETIVIPTISENLDQWTVIKSQAVQYSAAEVIVDNFNESFNNIQLSGETYEEKYEFLTKLVSRNSKLLEWYSAQKIKYSDLAQLPLFAKDLIEPKKFKSLQNDLTALSDVVKESVDQRILASNEYKKKLNLIDINEKRKISEIKSKDQVLKILSLNSSQLPLTLSLAIENFTPLGDTKLAAENKKIYVRETLTQFKIGLLKFLNDNPNTDIDDVIDKLGLK